MKKFRTAFIALIVLSFIFAGTALAQGSLPEANQWVAPQRQASVSFIEIDFFSVWYITIDGVTFFPPGDGVIFAGDAAKFTFDIGTRGPVKICFIYPKALIPDGTWHPQIYYLYNNGLIWAGFPTTLEYLADYPGIPYACTYTWTDGVFIVADHWTNP